MAIGFVGINEASNPGGSSLSITMPSAATPGQLAIAYVSSVTAPDPYATPTGWTLVGNDSGEAEYIFSRIVQSGDPGSVFTFNAAGGAAGAMAVYSGVAAVGPVSCATYTTLVAPSVTARESGDWLLCFWALYGTASGSQWYVTSPGGMTQDIGASYADGGGSRAGGFMSTSFAHLLLSSSGATATQTGVATYTSGGNNFSVAASLILYSIAPPPAPTLNSPANGAYLDLAAGQTFSWTYNGVGAPQTGYYFERVLSGTSSWWTGSAFTGSATLVSSSATSIAFGGGAIWSDATTYTWLVNTANSAGTGTYSGAFTVIGETAPTLSVSAPTGTQTTMGPTVTWSASFPTTAPTQVTYRICVYSSAQYGASGFTPGVSAATYDSGIVNSTATSATSGQLTATGTYRAYVQVTDAHQASAWEYSQFTQSVTVPSAPTLTAAWQSSSASVLLTATGSGTFDSQPTYASFFYSDNGGTTWAWVRGGSNVSMSTGTATLTDYEIPANATREYYATSSAVVSSLVYPSSPSTTQSATSSLSNWWLKNPLSSGQNITVEVSADFATTRVEQSTVNYLLGQDLPVVIYDTIAGTDGSITVTTTTSAAYTALETILGAQAILLLQSVFGGNWYVRLAITTSSASTAQESSTLSASSAASPYRTSVISYVNVAMPPITS